MSKKLKILACCHRMDFSGAPLLLHRLLAALADKHDIAVLRPMGETAAPGLIRDYEAAGISIVREARPQEYDLVIANTLACAEIVLKTAGKVPTLYWVHEPQDGLTSVLKGRTPVEPFLRADSVVFPTRWQAEELYAPYLQGRQVDIVPYGIPPRGGQPAKPFSLPEGTTSLLQLGWLASRKGQDVTLVAPDILDDPTVHVFMAGSPDVTPVFAERLKAKVANSPRLSRQVHFLGSISPAEVDAYLTHVDAMIFPTNDDLISVSILEAMARKTCVISSDFGPIPETVVDGETGLLFPVRDADRYADCIRRLMTDKALCQRIAEGGYEIGQRKHGFAAHVDAMEAVFLRTANA